MVSSILRGELVSVCPVCFHESEPIAGRCPSCSAPRARASKEEATPLRPSAPHTATGPRLILKGPGGEVTEYPLGQSSVLGRSTTASVRLADREVSRKHSQIDRERDLNERRRRILESAFDLIPCDNGVILLRDPHSQELVIQSMRQRKPGQGKVLVSDTLLAQVQLTKEGVLTSDAIADKRFQASHSIIALGVRSAMAVPLLTSSGEDVKGIMFLDSRERIAAFTTKDLEVLSAIAAQASVALENSEYARALEFEATQRAQLARFLSPALVEQAARGSIELSKGGALSELTILFSDIRGFTRLAEKMPAQEVVRMLNDYFEVMVDILFEHNGILDKFIGDAIMGLWGAPVKRPDDATNAVRAAVKMQKRVAEWNEERVGQGKVPIRIGIGLHTGQVVVGNMGSSKALSYTAIGDGVNLASRLCGIAGEDMIVISEECAQRAGKEKCVLESLPPARVKNREAPVEIYRVLEALE